MKKAQQSPSSMSYSRKLNAKQIERNKSINILLKDEHGKSIMVFIPASSPLRSSKTPVKSTVDSSVTPTLKYLNDSLIKLPVPSYSYSKYPDNSPSDLTFNKPSTEIVTKATSNSPVDLSVIPPIIRKPTVKSLIPCEISANRSSLSDESSEIQGLKLEPNEESAIADNAAHKSIKKKRKQKIYSDNNYYCEDNNQPQIKKTKLENSPSSLKTKPNLFHIKLLNKEIILKPKKIMTQKYEEEMTSSDEISLQPNGTKIKAELFKTIKWNSPTTATRKLLSIIFSNETLATHSLTGKPSPAFIGVERPLKEQLNPYIIHDIITTVVSHTNGTPREIRVAITRKCAESAKLIRNTTLNKNTQ